MKKRALIIGSIFVAIICVILIFCEIFGFLLINSNGSRYMIIDDNNRQEIGQLIFQNIKTDESLPDIDSAIKVKWQSLMHKDQIVIDYVEKDSYVFNITNRYENALLEHIKTNGKVIYFQSKDFVVDLVKTSLYSFC